MDSTKRQALIDQYEDGYRVVAEALQHITAAELDARAGSEMWTVREIVHHLADSEMIGGIRLRRLLAEEQPTIDNYDEATYARRLHYDRPIDSSLEAFRGARLSSAALLAALSEADWTRTGTHSSSGAYSVETWLEIYAAHGHDHAAQIRQARAATVAAAPQRER